MAKSSKAILPSSVVDTVSSDTLEKSVPVSYTKTEQSVKVRSKFPARLKLVGASSGKQYVWQAAGSVVEVDAVDARDLLSKKMGSQTCCGGTQQKNFLFEIA